MKQGVRLGRRDFVGWVGALGSGVSPMAVAAAAVAQDRPAFTREMMVEAEEMAGIRLTEAQRDLALPVLQNYLQNMRQLREMSVPSEVPPATCFLADPGATRMERRTVSPAPKPKPARRPQGGPK